METNAQKSLERKGAKLKVEGGRQGTFERVDQFEYLGVIFNNKYDEADKIHNIFSRRNMTMGML